MGITFHPLFLMMFMLPAILIVIDLISYDFNTSPIIFGLSNLRKTKRIYTQYGRFYIIIKNDSMACLYQDKIFWLKHIDYTGFGSIDQVRSWAKSQYESIYRTKKAKNEVIDQLKGWNGHMAGGITDLQTERDKKLDKIL